ncbi:MULTISPECIES: phage tail tape measure protein [Vibrio harveyi group]|uniref:phage tail tape measure protein n=1 Tax=Vibrio harveyi group TaxID=717610 RepID=UPI0011238DCB|nr:MULTISPECIES: phage tail tape measure protein [Vibrio harveyi group]MBE5145614.1 phage tail tape measure protein [Vibrio parahaemolyticus]MBT0052647.1 phage tail tape measure protein [Vibrio alginolyticus]MCR9374480.1 phage tail tape measure protein [Vibrio alginolyticus]MCR9408453.1 phage tail tape measure protein [Vibrio alginolyticus]TNZ12509.1 phage tail tape measure protein [Vibrio parahaemolyticus]
MLPEALRFQVGLIDQISKPLGNIQRNLNDVTNTYRQGTHTMMAGAAGMVGAGFALQQALMPAIEMDRALGEVKSLGVADDQLKTLTQTAMKFSVEYGKSATEFVAASYDIKSAMGDMTGDELAGVTRSSAILAAATKADTATITNYMGTMYSVFKDQADRIGKDNWAEQVAGMTAKSVERFKTTGQGMSDAFKGVGALGKTHGVAIQEQMAVLGLLQGSMTGSEAGTRYKAFMNGVVKAQDKLGMSFTDSNGKMLPMFDIMSKLRNQFGDLDSLEIDQIKQAFGSDEAVLLITDLIGKTNELQSSVKDLNDASNLNTAINMAGAMTDQWERLEQGVFAVRTAFGAALLPSLLPVISSLADGAIEIIEWTEMFPNLTKYIGFAAMAILGAAAAGGAFTLMMGVGKQVMATYMLTMKMFTGVNFLLTKGMAALRVAMLAVNIAMMANPIGFIAGAVVAAIAAVGALIFYWDDLKASFGDTTWFQVLEGAITLITLPFRAMFEFIKAGWQWVMSGFTDTSGFAFIGDMANSIKDVFSGVFNWISQSLAGIWDSVKGLIDWIPGLGGDDEVTQVKSKSVQSATPRAQIQPGGAAKNIASYQTSSTNYGGVAIYPTYMNSPQDIASEIEMAAG